jgi:N-acyl-D-aspartate/D-glutamate deacylase
MVRNAVERGEVRARIDTIPRSTGHLMSKRRIRQFITAITDELFNKGEQAVIDALRTPEGREIIMRKAFIVAGDKGDIFIVNSADASLENRSVADIARGRGADPDACMLDLLADDNPCAFWLGGPSRQDFPATGHPDAVARNPYVSAGSDRVMGDGAVDPWDWYELQRIGCQAIFMQMYLEKGVPLQEIVRRNTGMIADHFGIEGRGKLLEGNFADISVIDLSEFKYPAPDQMHYKTPSMRAGGVNHVLVNGRLAHFDGEIEKVHSGRVLRKGVGV